VIVLDCFRVSFVFANICLCVLECYETYRVLPRVFACFRAHRRVSARSRLSAIGMVLVSVVLCFVRALFCRIS
jgi:hypothetical protein